MNYKEIEPFLEAIDKGATFLEIKKRIEFIANNYEDLKILRYDVENHISMRESLMELDYPLSWHQEHENTRKKLLENKEISQEFKDNYLVDSNIKMNQNIQSKLLGLKSTLEIIDVLLEDISITKKEINTKSSINWKGTPTELMELIKALIVCDKVSGTQKDIIKNLSAFLNIEINNPDKILQDIKNRNNGSETLFLDKLKNTLYNLIQEKNKRQ